ncbi:polyprenyl synthetase family protein, partial [Candidatus Darwinibacter acetoxidans]
ALLGGASPEQLEKITHFGENFGLAFQITDDILDEVGEAEQLGKAVRADQRLGKQTYPRLFGLKESEKMAQQCVDECHRALEGFPEQAWLLRELASFILQRDH